MKNLRKIKFLSFAVLLVLVGCDISRTDRNTSDITAGGTINVGTEQISVATAVDDKTIANPKTNEWLSYGRDYAEQRYVPLKQINKKTVKNMGLAYSVDLGTKLGNQATPLLVDGLLIFPINWNVVVAIDARTGEERWRYDPKVSRRFTRVMGGATARGVAAYEGKILVPTLDGRLLALNANDGTKLWETNTFDGGNCGLDLPRPPCYISGAPRVARGKVFIGFGGADNNARGYMSAYDVNTGELLWRFYTVPRDPSKLENPELALAATTWSEGWWKEGLGGGGTVWDTIVYDEAFDQLLIGTSNGGGAYPRHIRSPGGGDNLFLASIIALDTDTGKMKWYYQQIPGEQWDFTSTQQLILTDLAIDGETRPVVMQAPKNGFFYVLDRRDGKLLRADKFAKVTWADSVDMETGRPIETAVADYSKKAQWIAPSALGAHNWQPMAYSPDTELVYIPGRESVHLYGVAKRATDKDGYQAGFSAPATGLEVLEFNDLLAQAEPPPVAMQGFLSAFDPVKGETKWRKPLRHFWNGGVVATAGGLVFGGDAMGMFEAYDADTGEVLWSFDTYTSIVAPPISYELDGSQYIALLTGTGMFMHAFGYTGPTAAHRYGNEGELLVFKLDGEAELKQPPLVDRSIPEPPAQTGSAEDIAAGDVLYHTYCFLCHGPSVRSASPIPDLRRMHPAMHQIFEQIVLDGVLESMGMVGFSDVLNEKSAQQVRAYIISRAREDYKNEGANKMEFRGGM